MADFDTSVFVSHAGEDEHAALDIVAELEHRDIRCWIASRDMRPGESYNYKIPEAIEASQATVLIFSERCNGNEYILREVMAAINSRKKIIVFRIENTGLSKELSFLLSPVHWIDGFVDRERKIDELARALPPAVVAFGTQSENPDQLIGSPVWDCYEELFPIEEERDDPVHIIDWLRQAWHNETEWVEVFFTISDNRKCIGIAYLSMLRPCVEADKRPNGWWFGNYYGILNGWREDRKAGEFLSVITEKCEKIFPASKGIIFEVERFDDRYIQSTLAKLQQKKVSEPRGQITLSNDEKYSVRAARRIGLYTAVGDRGPQRYMSGRKGALEPEKLITRALSLVFKDAADEKFKFVDYIQPAMKEPLNPVDEVKLWLMVYPMTGLDILEQAGSGELSQRQVDEFFDFVYNELFPSAYSRNYEGGTSADSAIDGFDIYVRGLRDRVQAPLMGKHVALVKQNMLSAAAKQLIGRYKNDLDALGLGL
jgi:hypothetical protein